MSTINRRVLGYLLSWTCTLRFGVLLCYDLSTCLNLTAPASSMSQQGAQSGSQQQQQSSSSSNVPVKKECNVPGKSCWVLWRTTFEIDNHYTPIKAIGKGAYGVVCSAKNLQTGEKVAIKKIGNAFENLTDARRTLREIKLLRHLKHENIIAVRDILKPPTKDKFNDVYLVYELMDTDLHQIIRSSQPLTNEHFQYFVYQVFTRPTERW